MNRISYHGRLTVGCCIVSATEITSITITVGGTLVHTHTHTHARTHARTHAHTHTHPFNSPFSRTTRVGLYQKGKTNLDFTEARDSEWRWHHLGICKSAPRSRQNNHASTSPLSFLQAGCPFCRPTNSVKALKAQVRSFTCVNITAILLVSN